MDEHESKDMNRVLEEGVIDDESIQELSQTQKLQLTELLIELNSFSQEEIRFCAKIINLMQQLVFANLKENLAEFEPILEQINNRFLGILPYLNQAGFASSPMLPLNFLLDIEGLIRDNRAEPESVCRLLVDISEADDHDILKCMVRAWKREAYFASRFVLLDDALEAHINGKYSLSIPALLPLIEGYFNSFSVARKRLLDDMEKYFASITGAEQMMVDSTVAIMRDYIFRTAHFYSEDERTSYLSFKNNPLMQPEQILNRHGVLHGFDYQYASKENSLRVFFAIDTLVWLREEYQIQQRCVRQ